MRITSWLSFQKQYSGKSLPCFTTVCDADIKYSTNLDLLYESDKLIS